MMRPIIAAALMACAAAPAFAETPPADLALYVAVVEWTAANCPAGSVPPPAYVLSGLASAMGAADLIPAARADLAARMDANDKPVEELCAFFSRAIGQTVGEMAAEN